MHKKSSFSSKVLPLHKKVLKPSIPSIKLLPKLRNSNKIAPELSNSTTSNSKSTSFIGASRNTTVKTKTLIQKSKEMIEISDSLCLEEYKKSEILRSRKIHNSRFPY